MKQRDELIIICIAAIAVTIAVAAVVLDSGGSGQKQTDGIEPSVSWTITDLGDTVDMYSPAYESDASDAYGSVSGYATDDGGTYHWYAYAVTWSADPGTTVYPGNFHLSCIDEITDQMGVTHVFDLDYGYWSLGFFVPEADNELPLSAAVPQSGALTLTIVLPVHVGTHSSAHYDDDGWTY